MFTFDDSMRELNLGFSAARRAIYYWKIGWKAFKKW